MIICFKTQFSLLHLKLFVTKTVIIKSISLVYTEKKKKTMNMTPHVYFQFILCIDMYVLKLSNTTTVLEYTLLIKVNKHF